jgi:hypothetical protein
MNIVEAFKIGNKNLIIFITGISGSGISVLGRELAKILKLDIIYAKDYCSPKYNEKIKLENGKTIINWDTENIYDWKEINMDIEKKIKKENKGIILVSTIIPKNKIKITPHFYICVKLSEENILGRRNKYIDTLKDERCKNIEDYKDMEKEIFKTITYPFHMKIYNSSNITKFINADEHIESDDYYTKIIDDAFDYLMKEISEEIKKFSNDKNRLIRDKIQETEEESSSSTDVEKIIKKRSNTNKIKISRVNDYNINDSSSVITEDFETDESSDNITLSSDDSSILDDQPYIIRNNKTYDVI